MTGPQGNYGIGRFHGRFEGFVFGVLAVVIGVWLYVEYKNRNNAPHLT